MKINTFSDKLTVKYNSYNYFPDWKACQEGLVVNYCNMKKEESSRQLSLSAYQNWASQQQSMLSNVRG